MVQVAGVHMPYLWAAYRRGVFEWIAPELTPKEFEAAFEASMADLLAIGGDAFVLTAKTAKGVIPVGLADLVVHHGQGWPHVLWFPESTLRIRLECAARFFTIGQINLVVAALPEDVALFDHLCKYGVLRRIGTGLSWHEGRDATLFETVRNVQSN